ncbi:MAG TPA: LamG domain-containing protein, partial [Thermoguttaceae bacterium]|nr:LamG domain-containing protein [Thermoguttaceae bacterium]
GAGNVVGNTTLNDGEWHHVALTMIRGATVSYPDVQLWLDGKDDTRATMDPDPFSITAGVDMAIGYRATAAARYFLGAIDDVRLYDRALTQEEIAWLSGRTMPFDKPF